METYKDWLKYLKKDGTFLFELLVDLEISKDQAWQKQIVENMYDLLYTAVSQDADAIKSVVRFGPKHSFWKLSEKELENIWMLAVKNKPETVSYLPNYIDPKFRQEALRQRPDLWYKSISPTIEQIIIGITMFPETKRYLNFLQAFSVTLHSKFKDFSAVEKMEIIFQCFGGKFAVSMFSIFIVILINILWL